MKQQYVLWGAGNKSLEVEQIISNTCPDTFCDYCVEFRDLGKIGTELPSKEGNRRKRVISIDEMQKLYKKQKINGVIFPTTYHMNDWKDIWKRSIELGIKKEHILAVPIDTIKRYRGGSKLHRRSQ